MHELKLYRSSVDTRKSVCRADLTAPGGATPKLEAFRGVDRTQSLGANATVFPDLAHEALLGHVDRDRLIPRPGSILPEECEPLNTLFPCYRLFSCASPAELSSLPDRMLM